MATRATNRPAIFTTRHGLMDFVFTVDAFNTASDEKLDTSHWTISAPNAEVASELITIRADNAMRTIPSIRHRIIDSQRYQRGICSYLDRNLYCLGHSAMTPLKQERGGNEGAQI